MTNDSADVPAAWHPDPTGQHELRYWDGSAWTDHVSDQGNQSLAPMTAQSATEPTDSPNGDLASSEIAPKKRRKWPLITLASVLGVILLVAIVGAINGGMKKAVAGATATPPAAAAPPTTTPTPAAPKVTTPPPAPAPKVAHQEFSGSGDMVEAVNITAPAVVTFRCDACGSNTVLKSNGAESLIVNEIGAYSGQHLINVRDNSLTTEFTINADADWSLVIDDLSIIPPTHGPASGHGDSVLVMSDKFTTAAVTNVGESNFLVMAYGRGNVSPLIVNEIGSYSGTVKIAGPAYITVNSSGDWSITPQ
ncbi:hypothetical protein RL72_03297 [Microbacterium azadirachtae]|uniref:DUF2510 domain-containing protein n=2 Tax=Microbacterium azadirachtae TaxID=582680 RepID=A0A0F0KFB8_9MICO|nr:hypothetical protein RL72_03297 [Microbacterium azadirachtae]